MAIITLFQISFAATTGTMTWALASTSFSSTFSVFMLDMLLAVFFEMYFEISQTLDNDINEAFFDDNNNNAKQKDEELDKHIDESGQEGDILVVILVEETNVKLFTQMLPFFGNK
ncbi:hypothetical protein RFI_29067 [Reticulomyxa filosa]|uniref:Uncharacterized protein n=1 Tax=Reticulomyxa filosa TaxID=46433 RepID=X6M4C6_RETFI|nr:hypothetical protein RFI_29067 [Reticulomyxa filosa]|eukprot:ETO08322.1 hypothetical protein RFI_29067 [Reticulomyxa filosa]